MSLAKTNPSAKTDLVDRIGKLLRMLSSDQIGEAGAAAQALNRTLVGAGLDIHKLATVVEAGLQLPLPIGQPPKRRRPQTTKTNQARRPDGRPLTMDERLVCDAPNGLFRPCVCGWIRFTVMPGIGPHVAQLTCDACHRGGRWLSRAHFGATS
jgi:hypothetical protein